MRRFAPLVALLLCAAAGAQTLYKYRDADGNWHFTDRRPEQTDGVVADALAQGNLNPKVHFERDDQPDGTVVRAINEFHGPVELVLELSRRDNVSLEVPSAIETVLPAASSTAVVALRPQDPGRSMRFAYGARYMVGDPAATHEPDGPYRAPYALGATHRVTQAWPDQTTHGSEASRYAIDIAMPEGTPVHAAREGTVLAIAYDSYTGGTDRERDGPKANSVRILHRDGTMAIYAHLKFESIRVRPGARVGRGQYIADSGNTGFSSGPHLHFAVERNTGLELQSIPVEFAGAGGRPVTAATGQMLTAW